MSGINKAKARQGRVHKGSYTAYANNQRREINKARKLIRHLRKYPGDVSAMGVLKGLPANCLKRARETFSKLPDLLSAGGK